MIHVVFQQADIHTLKKAIELDETLAGDVIQIRDDFAVGPIENLDTEEGWATRENWWRSLLNDSPYANENLVGSFDDRKTVEEIKQRLNENEKEELWIWMGQNQHDVCSYYWIISQLKDYQGKVVILYFNNLPFINDKGQIFYPTALHEILPKEFLKAKKLNRKVTLSEFEVDPDEWTRLQNEDKGVRLLEGGKKLGQKDHDFYDEELKKFITNDWQKASKIINTYLNKSKHTTGDAYLLWRLKQLIAAGVYDAQGELKGMKDFEVKGKSAQPAAVTEQAPQ